VVVKMMLKCTKNECVKKNGGAGKEAKYCTGMDL